MKKDQQQQQQEEEKVMEMASFAHLCTLDLCDLLAASAYKILFNSYSVRIPEFFLEYSHTYASMRPKKIRSRLKRFPERERESAREAEKWKQQECWIEEI